MIFGGIQERARGKNRFVETGGLSGLTSGTGQTIFCEVVPRSGSGFDRRSYHLYRALRTPFVNDIFARNEQSQG